MDTEAYGIPHYAAAAILPFDDLTELASIVWSNLIDIAIA